MFSRRVGWVGLLAAAVAACGGDPSPTGAPARGASPQALRSAFSAAVQRHPGSPPPSSAPAPALPSDVDEETAALQLLDFGERSFPDLFPGRPATGRYEGYVYRYYPETGVYLGVRDRQVYVMGGSFGSTPLAVGPLMQFMTPSSTARLDWCRDRDQRHAAHTTLSPATGKNIALAIGACNDSISAPQWRQTGGPTVKLVADKTQAISFVAETAGQYRFEVRFAHSGEAMTQALSFTVAGAAPQQLLTLRSSHAVRMGGKASVRAWTQLPEGETVEGITWQQLDGPTVKLDTTDSKLATFVAPSVERDSLVRLRATLRTSGGRVDADEVVVLIERHLQADASDPDAMWAGEHVPRVYAYRPQGPHASKLQGCVYDTALAFGNKYNLCAMLSMPVLASKAAGGIPTVEQVMDHVVVSHDWMGRNFEQLLRNHDPNGDFRRMLSSVTAVVIGSHIRPSFYYPGTGAIYLDASSFWLTPEERDTLNEVPDYRSAFGDGLMVDYLWRYVLGGKSLFSYFDPEERVTRQLIDVRNEVAPLLYHELGHALDFLPPSDYAALRSEMSAWAFIARRYFDERLTSDTMPRGFPLNSALLKELAKVRYQGATATAEQKALTPEEVGRSFAADQAVDEYSYSSPREDVAMMLEEFMMSHRLGIPRDLAFTGPIGPEDTTRSIIVRWGQRGRIGQPALANRARAVVRELVPWVDVTEVDRLPAPISLRVGESWQANLGSPTVVALSASSRRDSPAALRAQFQQELRLMQHHRHVGRKPLPPLPPPERMPR